MTDTEQIKQELRAQRKDYDEVQELFEQGEVVDESIPSMYGILSGYAIGIGICLVTLGKDNASKWFRRGAEFELTTIEKIEKYKEIIERSYQLNRPTIAKEALHKAILAGEDELVTEAIDTIKEIDRSWILQEAPEREHVLYYGQALAAYVYGEEDDARSYLTELQELDHGYLMYEGLEVTLEALLDEDETLLHDGLEMVLRAHQEEYQANPDTAAAFLSVDAMVYQRLAEREGLTVDRNQLPENLQSLLPEKLPEPNHD